MSGSNSAGRVRPCQGRCRGFESRLPLHRIPSPFRRPIKSDHVHEILLFRSSLRCAVWLSAQDYKMEPAGAPPSDLPPAFASLMSPKGYKISRIQRAVLRGLVSQFPAGGKEIDGRQRGLSDHSPRRTDGRHPFPGTGRRPARAADQGRSVHAALQQLSVNGDHLGVAPQRDFLVLTPAADDKDPNATPAFDELMAMSKKASGTPHPAVLSMEPPPPAGAARALTQGRRARLEPGP